MERKYLVYLGIAVALYFLLYKRKNHKLQKADCGCQKSKPPPTIREKEVERKEREKEIDNEIISVYEKN
tara:strand:- start:187 stop:393 length:207 start_codon:yes stop_codon:yes gene_type:complete